MISKDEVVERIRDLRVDSDDCAAMLERERNQRQLDVGSQEYRGNTVSYMYDKAKCYGDMVHGCSPALAAAGFAPDEFAKDGQVGAIARAVKAMAEQRATLEKERDEALKKQPINTHLRLFDLVRDQRTELHAAALLTDEEYAWLSYGSSQAHSKEGGSPSRKRLEDYDELKRDLAAARRDTERLDWTEKMVTQYPWIEDHGLSPMTRAAIDSSMEGQK
jgi:hypothetical protein